MIDEKQSIKKINKNMKKGIKKVVITNADVESMSISLTNTSNAIFHPFDESLDFPISCRFEKVYVDLDFFNMLKGLSEIESIIDKNTGELTLLYTSGEKVLKIYLK